MKKTFSDQIKEFTLSVKGQCGETIAEVRKRVSYEIIDNTPFDTISPGDGGRAKASWVPTIDSPGTSDDSERDKSGNLAKSKVDAVSGRNTDSDYYLTSTCDYINVLEFGGYPNPPLLGTYLKAGQSKDGHVGPGHYVFSENGFSRKAPNGMVRIVVENFSNIVDEVSKEVKK